jgi:diguanylate cyclase (GGDEF)-like protein
MAGPLLIALSALRQRWGAGDYAQVERTATLLERAGVALPIGAAGFGFFLILEVVARDARGSLLTVAGAAALCAIVLARQIYTAAQNERLATDLQTRYRQLEALAALDPLTQISNRGAFESYLAHAWERAARDRTPLALLMCDIDYFKRINDAAGHLAGDDCLRRVAWVVRDQARRRGALAARYGGEEFAVVLPGARLEDARVAAKKVARGLKRAKLPHPDSPFGKVTLSIGVAWVTPGATGAPRELVDAADKALYRAKSNGRNQVVAA